MNRLRLYLARTTVIAGVVAVFLSAGVAAAMAVVTSASSSGSPAPSSAAPAPATSSAAACHLYWADAAGTIMEANLDGTGAHGIASDPNRTLGVAVGP